MADRWKQPGTRSPHVLSSYLLFLTMVSRADVRQSVLLDPSFWFWLSHVYCYTPPVMSSSFVQLDYRHHTIPWLLHGSYRLVFMLDDRFPWTGPEDRIRKGFSSPYESELPEKRYVKDVGGGGSIQLNPCLVAVNWYACSLQAYNIHIYVS